MPLVATSPPIERLLDTPSPALARADRGLRLASIAKFCVTCLCDPRADARISSRSVLAWGFIRSGVHCEPFLPPAVRSRTGGYTLSVRKLRSLVNSEPSASATQSEYRASSSGSRWRENFLSGSRQSSAQTAGHPARPADASACPAQSRISAQNVQWTSCYQSSPRYSPMILIPRSQFERQDD